MGGSFSLYTLVPSEVCGMNTGDLLKINEIKEEEMLLRIKISR